MDCQAVKHTTVKATNVLYLIHRHPFTPPKLSAYIDEAKTYAAEYTLQTLGIPIEGTEAPAAAPAFPGM